MEDAASSLHEGLPRRIDEIPPISFSKVLANRGGGFYDLSATDASTSLFTGYASPEAPPTSGSSSRHGLSATTSQSSFPGYGGPLSRPVLSAARQAVPATMVGVAGRPRSAGHAKQLARAGSAAAAANATAGQSTTSRASPKRQGQHDADRPRSTRMAGDNAASPSPPRPWAARFNHDKSPAQRQRSMSPGQRRARSPGHAAVPPEALLDVLMRIAQALEKEGGNGEEVMAAASAAAAAAGSMVGLPPDRGNFIGGRANHEHMPPLLGDLDVRIQHLERSMQANAVSSERQQQVYVELGQIRAHARRLEHEIADFRVQMARRLDEASRDIAACRREADEARAEAALWRERFSEAFAANGSAGKAAPLTGGNAPVPTSGMAPWAATPTNGVSCPRPAVPRTRTTVALATGAIK
mmetsp:Transcript_41491/g.75179  ORF Transcript_41491/g.75179 Transcript_41491/m.75179 type:complete len:412 (+) Transcript_41491:83-1318(+)